MGCLTAPFKVLGCLGRHCAAGGRLAVPGSGAFARAAGCWAASRRRRRRVSRRRSGRPGATALGERGGQDRLAQRLARRLGGPDAVGGRLRSWVPGSSPAVPEGAGFAAGRAARRRGEGARTAPHRAAPARARRPAGGGAAAATSRWRPPDRCASPGPARANGRCDRSRSATFRCPRAPSSAWSRAHWRSSRRDRSLDASRPASAPSASGPGGAVLYGAPRP